MVVTFSSLRHVAVFLNTINCNVQPQACNFIKKKILAQLLSCEFCEISKNTFPYRTPPVANSEYNGNMVKD